MTTTSKHLANIVEGLLQWAISLRTWAERNGLKLAANHARLVEAELRILTRMAPQLPPNTVKEKIRLLHMELNWLQDEIQLTPHHPQLLDLSYTSPLQDVAHRKKKGSQPTQNARILINNYDNTGVGGVVRPAGI